MLHSAQTPQGALRLMEHENDFVVVLVTKGVVQWRVHHRAKTKQARAAAHKSAKRFYDVELARVS